MNLAYNALMNSDRPKYRCPFTVDWVRNQADDEIQQLVLIEVPSQKHRLVVFDVGPDSVAHEVVCDEDDDSKSL